MKILYWTENFAPVIGGTEILCEQLIKEMSGRGHRVLVVTSQTKDSLPKRENLGGIPIFRFPFLKGIQGDIKTLIKTKKEIEILKKDFSPDIFHIHSYGTNIFYHLETEKTYSAPNFLTVHMTPLANSSSQSIEAKKFLCSDWISAVSNDLLTKIYHLFPSTKNRVSIISNGMKMPEVEPNPLNANHPKILFIGRLLMEKGLDICIEAFSKLLMLVPKVRLIIAGDGPERSHFEDYARDLGIESKIKFLGWVPADKIYPLINNSYLVTVPSRSREGFGLAALQASQMGRPVIATKIGGLPEVVCHGKTGIIIEEGDVTALTRSMEFLISNPSIAGQYGREGRRRAINQFGFERMVNEYEHIYQKLHQNRSEMIS